MPWLRSYRADTRAAAIADRHYNRQKPGTRQFVPPGRCLVLLTGGADALWVSSWPKAEYVKHEWAGAWICSCFRNESSRLSSDLIVRAEAATRHAWGDPPSLGFVTFIDRSKTRGKKHPGYCYLKAGWEYVGHHKFKVSCPACATRGYPCGMTKGGLIVVRRDPAMSPWPMPPAEDRPLFRDLDDGEGWAP